ncbi:MAG TPA: aldolase [Nocardioides sp.]|nr:aldolase [Nocardioides sp.]
MDDDQRGGVDIEALTAEINHRLEDADAALARDYPGERAGRQPVHTLYVPADQVEPELLATYANRAQMSIVEFGSEFLDVLDGDEDLVGRVLAKLEREPIEDLRIDFEDGYGARSDDEEDETVRETAAVVARWVKDGAAPPFHGIRFKSLEPATRSRGLRTLALFVEGLVGDGALPDGFVVTLPKVTSVDQVEAMTVAAEWLEKDLSLRSGSLRFELQIETPQAVVGSDGTVQVARMIHASAGRCLGLHYGTYDYSADLGIAPAQQSLEHPAADHAKAVMQAAVAGTGVRLSDGSTNVLPVGDADAMRDAWANHRRLVRRSLERGLYQGWDLHPAQLPTRYAATFEFFRSGLEPAVERLRAYGKVESTSIQDEPATVRAMAAFLLRGLDCGALADAEVVTASGLNLNKLTELAGRPIEKRKAG